MKIQDDIQPYDEINVTPMLDLAYVLLVIFIIMTTASVQGVRVDSPKAQTTSSLARPQTKAVTIAPGGELYLDAYPVSIGELEQRLAQLKSINPSQPVVVKGDAHVNYAKVMEVLELFKRLEITEVGLVTRHPSN